MLDRVNINIDRVSGVNKGDEKVLDGLRSGINVSAWNKQKPIIAKFQVRTQYILQLLIKYYLLLCLLTCFVDCFLHVTPFPFLVVVIFANL